MAFIAVQRRLCLRFVGACQSVERVDGFLVFHPFGKQAAFQRHGAQVDLVHSTSLCNSRIGQRPENTGNDQLTTYVAGSKKISQIY